MATIAIQQRGLLALLKQRPVEYPEDEWLARIAGSPELAMLREIAVWWRCFQVSAACKYTSRMLALSGSFETTVAAYFDRQATTPYIESLARGFLEDLRNHPDPLVVAVSQTEVSMQRMEGEVLWDRNPDVVFGALDRGEPLPCRDPGFTYRLKIGRELEGGVQCVRSPNAS